MVPLSTPPATTTLVTDLPVGTIGPDGCVYSGSGDAVWKVTNALGGCDFLPSTATPSLSLAPSLVAPDPAQGTSQTFTASFRNLTVPAGTPVFMDHMYTVVGFTRNSAGTITGIQVRYPWWYDGIGNDGNPNDGVVTITPGQMFALNGAVCWGRV